MECGCEVTVDHDVIYCPMHAAAGDMLLALEAEDEVHTHSHGEMDCADPLGCSQFAGLYRIAMKLRPEAIAAARGGAL